MELDSKNTVIGVEDMGKYDGSDRRHFSNQVMFYNSTAPYTLSNNAAVSQNPLASNVVTTSNKGTYPTPEETLKAYRTGKFIDWKAIAERGKQG